MSLRECVGLLIAIEREIALVPRLSNPVNASMPIGVVAAAAVDFQQTQPAARWGGHPRRRPPGGGGLSNCRWALPPEGGTEHMGDARHRLGGCRPAKRPTPCCSWSAKKQAGSPRRRRPPGGRAARDALCARLALLLSQPGGAYRPGDRGGWQQEIVLPPGGVVSCQFSPPSLLTHSTTCNNWRARTENYSGGARPSGGGVLGFPGSRLLMHDRLLY